MPPRVADPGWPDESVVKGTGCTWDRWLAHLDRWGATERTHTEIARHLTETFDISGWWAQTVTVGYERARGMRAKHQTTKGFAVSASKTLPVAAEALWPFVAEASGRKEWVPASTLRQRKLLPIRNARFDGPEGALVIVWLDAKGASKTTIGVQVEKLPDAGSVERVRAFWKERLAVLADKVV
jgi:hypothetical protein